MTNQKYLSDKEKFNQIFKNDVIETALAVTDFTELAHFHFKEYLLNVFDTPYDLAQEYLSPNEILDIIEKGE